MRNFRLKSQLRTALCLALFVTTLPVMAEETPKKTVAEMTADERMSLVAEMQLAVDGVLIAKQYFADDPLPIHATVSLNPDTNLVVLDLDERLAPNALSGEMEDMGDLIRGSLEPYMGQIEGVTGISYLFGGRDIDDLLPEPTPTFKRAQARFGQDSGTPSKPMVAVSPGHGIYYHSGYKDWRAQREPANGVLEDDITPVLAGNLVSDLEREGAVVHNFRYYGKNLIHTASGEPVWRLATRYELEAKLPDHPEIWHSRPDSTKRDRERDEDIRARPLYANFLGADALLLVHTNADKNAEVRGLRVITHGRPQDRALAERILCSSREMIHSSEAFATFPVAPYGHVDEHKGETKLAGMPAAIVEVGFHTNKEDAALLKDPEFQRLAMRGVAKGYRLFRENKPCADFAVKPGVEVEGRPGRDVHMPLAIEGNPTFPIRISHSVRGCTGRYCPTKSQSLYNQAEIDRFRVSYLCGRENVGKDPIDIDVKARDFFGVPARSASYRVKCIN